MVRQERLELSTNGLKARYSTIELLTHGDNSVSQFIALLALSGPAVTPTLRVDTNR